MDMTADRIKVLHIVETVHSGGVEKTRLSLAKQLDKGVYEQKLVCTNARGPIVAEFEREGVSPEPVGRFRGVWDVVRYWSVLKIIRRYRPDIIHGAVFEGVTMACVCGFLGRVPVVIAEETSDPENRSKKADWLLRTLCRAADNVVAISPGTEQYLRQRAKIAPAKIRLIDNGVDLPREVSQAEVAELKRQLGITETDFVVGSVGRLRNDHKRFTDIIRAVAQLNDPRVKVLLVGDGRDRDLIESCAREQRMSDQLIITGYQQDTSLYYGAMDVFCLASSREGFGLVAAEAMLTRLPVVATSVGGLKYVVRDEETGFLVPPLHPEIIAQKLAWLIRDRALCKALGEKGYERALHKYTAEVYVGKVDTMYRESLLRKRRKNK